MRRRLQTLSAVLAVLALAPSAARAETFAVPIDQGARIALPPGALSVMIGNPAIADISLLDSRNAMVTGRAYGVTNLLVVDGRGRTLMDRQIVVSAPEANRITSYRGSPNGLHAENYACSPRCERTPMPGETQLDYQTYSAAYGDYDRRGADARKSGGNTKVEP